MKKAPSRKDRASPEPGSRICRAHRHWNSTSYRTAAGDIQEIYGAEGSRTPDLCSAIAALSQLSYSPVKRERATTSVPVALRSLNDTTPLARGRTVVTKSIRTRPEVNQSYVGRLEKFRVTTSGSSGSHPARRPRDAAREGAGGCGQLEHGRSHLGPDYGSSADPNVGRFETSGERCCVEGTPSRLTDTAVSRSWKRAPFAACWAAS